MTALLRLEGLSCGYGEHAIVQQLDLTLEAGEIGCLLGPSGCGKTTTLRAIAGFEDIQQGRISLADEVLSRPGHTLPPEKRRIGMVFQDYALFPHLNVEDNIAFGIGKLPDCRQRVRELLELVNLEALAKRFPHALSGGQQQRVALARALAPSPRLLLLDEPFSNLDVELRRRLSHEVRDILKQRGTSAILVTHDQEEAFAVSDRVGVLKAGRLEQWDTPFNLYHQPLTPFVASFVGKGYFIPGRISDRHTIHTELGELTSQHQQDLPAASSVNVLLRPDDIVHAVGSPLQAQIIGKTFAGATTLYRLQLPSGTRLEAQFPSHIDLQPGQMAGIAIEAEHLVAFPVPGSIALEQTDRLAG